MKKLLALALVGIMSVGMLAGCGSTKEESSSDNASANASSTTAKTDSTAKSTEVKKIDKLNVYFVPSRDPSEITTATEPLKQLLQTELLKEGYDVKDVEITVGTTYEAVGEALSAGTADVGFIPGGTYVLYDDGADVILTATRAGLSKDSDNAKDWNDGKPTEKSSKQAVSYRGLIIAGPSKKGQELAKKVNDGEKLTWDDLNSANWAVMSSSSSSGYIYPSLWLEENYKKGITDLSSAVTSDSYGSSYARLAAGQVDVLVSYADARMDYADKWTTDYARSASIWDETNVIGVTKPIYNDTICVSKNSKIMDAGLKKAIQDAMINIAKTDDGKKVIAIYNHEGYQVAKSSDYDAERAAQKALQGSNK